MADAPKLLGTDTLRQAYPKFNQAIDNANESIKKATKAETNSNSALNTANTAEQKADSVQTQFNQVVIEGDSSVEAAQARVDAEGTSFTTLKGRLDNSDAKIKGKGLPHKDQKGAVVSFIFDDARQTVFDKALPIFQAHKKTASVALMAKNLEEQMNLTMTPRNVFDLINAGWDMLGHGYDSIQIQDTTTEETAIKEIVIAKEKANKYGVELSGYVSPSGTTPAKYLPLVEQNYAYAYANYSQGMVDYNKSIHALNRKNLESMTQADINTYLSDVLSKKGFLTFYMHEVVDDPTKGNSTTLIEYIITECARLGIRVMNVKDAVKYLFGAVDENNIIREHEEKLQMVDAANTILWSVVASTGEGFARTSSYNLQPIIKNSFSSSPYGTYSGYYKDFTIDTSQGNIYGEVHIPVYSTADRMKFETRIELLKDTTNTGIKNKTLIPAIVEKDLVVTKFFIPRYEDVNKLRIRFQITNDLDLNSASVFMYTPKLIINHS